MNMTELHFLRTGNIHILPGFEQRTHIGDTQINLMEYSEGMEDEPRTSQEEDTTPIQDSENAVISLKEYVNRRRHHPAGSRGNETAQETLDRLRSTPPDNVS